MKNDIKNIICPNCKAAISIDDVLTHQIEEKIKKEISEESKLREIEIAKERKEIGEQKAKLEELQKNAQSEVSKKVAEKLAVEKITLWKEAQTAAEKKIAAEVKLLEEQMKEKDKKLDEANNESLKARASKQQFEDEKKNFEIEKAKIIDAERKGIEQEAFVRAVKQSGADTLKLQKKLDDIEKEKEVEKKSFEEQVAEKNVKLEKAQKRELSLLNKERELDEKMKIQELEVARTISIEKGKIEEDVSKRISEEYRFRELESDKKMADLISQLNDAKRKAEQGSQQLQGEVLELDLEASLKESFPQDIIESIGKGVKGADVRQKVRSNSGKVCGVILWESKRVQNWGKDWIPKLKVNLRAEAAHIPVIVSVVLPDEAISGLGQKDGVWICKPSLAISLSHVLRRQLLEVALVNAQADKQGTLAETLYVYVTSHEFRQQVESMVETYKEMKDQITKERVAFEKSWKVRDAQVEKIFIGTANIVGSIQGKLGNNAFGPVKGLELLEDGEVKDFPKEE